MLTHCPDPVHLCDTGPGTAAEQSARPQLVADYVNGGWKPAGHGPMTALVAVAVCGQFTGDIGWLCYAAEPMDWASGALTDTNKIFTQLNLEPPGPHTITATAVDDGAVTTIDVLVRDQTIAPTLASLTPSTYPTDTAGELEILLTGTGFTADARPRAVLNDTPYEPRFELMSPTQMKIWVDLSAEPNATGPVFVWFPDGSTTYPRDLVPL